MKKKTKFQTLLRATLLLAALLATAFPSYSYDFVSNGIYYDINNDRNSVSVTFKDDNFNSYSGSVTIPSSVTYNGKTYSVTSIGNNAFRICSGLSSVTIPTSVKSINYCAFYKCTKLASVTIPYSVTSIGNYAFSDCTALATLYYYAYSCADFTSNLSYHPFRNTNISTLIIDDYVQRIPAFFAYGLTKITSVTIPYLVTSIGVCAFSDCTALNTLYFLAKSCADFTSDTNNHPFKNTNISTVIISGPQRIPAFFANNLTKITSVTIPTTVTSIGNSAFYNCYGLTSVTFPQNSVTSIGNSAFYNCHKLTSVTIPNSVTSIGNNAFSACSALETLNYKAISCADFSSDSNNHPFKNTIISTINMGDFVQRIPAFFANNMTRLASVTIPSSVTSIGVCAFSGCTALRTLDYKAKSCDDFYFDYSNNHNYTPPFYNLSISNIYIGGNVQRIPAYFAYGLSTLRSVTGFYKVASIGSGAFSDCTRLTSISLGNSVQTIGNEAFRGCTGLASVTFPNSVTTISSYAFSGCI